MREITRELYEERILRVQMHIQEHLDDELEISELAKVACFSRYHFHRLFSAMVGESLRDYIRRLRIERSASDLIYTDQQVTALALDAGYESHEAFTRAFKSQFGCSPTEYRKNLRAGSAPPAAGHGRKITATFIRLQGDSMEVRIEKLEPMTVAFVRHTGPYAQCGAAWGKLCGHPTVAPLMGLETLAIGVSYDDPDVTDADKLRMDCCVTVGEDFEATGGISRQVICGGDYAVLTHRGSMDGLHDCYRWLFGEWLPSSGREPQKTPCIEIFRKYDEKLPPEEWVTDICVPLV